jgi:hypothetical protein
MKKNEWNDDQNADDNDNSVEQSVERVLHICSMTFVGIHRILADGYGSRISQMGTDDRSPLNSASPASLMNRLERFGGEYDLCSSDDDRANCLLQLFADLSTRPSRPTPWQTKFAKASDALGVALDNASIIDKTAMIGMITAELMNMIARRIGVSIQDLDAMVGYFITNGKPFTGDDADVDNEHPRSGDKPRYVADGEVSTSTIEDFIGKSEGGN